MLSESGHCYQEGVALPVPLICMIAASNEIPDFGEFDALNDCFILKPTFPVYRKFYGGFIRKTRSESPRHAKILAKNDFVPKPEGKSFKTAWIHKSTFFKEIPLVRPKVPSNQEKALCEPGTKYPTQIPKPRECRLKCGSMF